MHMSGEPACRDTEGTYSNTLDISVLVLFAAGGGTQGQNPG